LEKTPGSCKDKQEIDFTTMDDQDLEKNPLKTTENPNVNPAAPTSSITFAHDLTRANKIRRPSGRLVHIASNPAEIPRLQRKLTSALPEEGGGGDQEFDIVVQGSAEHINALRETHSHHEQLRDELRRKYGNEFDTFEKVVKDLDHLQNELHQVSYHAVNLDANFGKYGYSATIRMSFPSPPRKGSLHR